jgi:hypothetical protein
MRCLAIRRWLRPSEGGAYVLKLKANHGPLWRSAVAAFAEAAAAGTLKAQETAEHGRDRSERRRGSVVPAPANAPDFPGLLRSAASKPNAGPPMASSPRPPTPSSCPSGCQPDG